MEKVGFDYYQNVFLGSEIGSKKVFEKLELYALSYIDKMWGIMRKEAFPEKIEL